MVGKKKKSSAKANPVNEPAPPQYVLSDLLQLTESENFGTWAEDLATEAGINLDKDICAAYETHRPIKELDHCHWEGCALIVEMLKRGLVRTAEAAPSAVRHADPPDHREVLKEIRSAAESLDAASQGLDLKLQVVTKQMSDLQQEIQTVKEAPSVALAAQETKYEASRSVLIAGLVPEGVSGSQALEQVREFISSEVQPTIEVEVVAVSRMGRYSEDMLSSRRIKVEFASAVQAQAMLRAAFNLKAFNLSKKKAGERPVGIDPFLTAKELAIKGRLKGLFDSERAKGTPKVFWRGCRLFANGQELKL